MSFLLFREICFLTPRVPIVFLHTKPPKKLTILVLGWVFKGLLGTPPPSLLSANAGFMVTSQNDALLFKIVRCRQNIFESAA